MCSSDLIIMVAIVLEALVEYAKTIINMVEAKEYKTAITQAITIILGIGLAFAFHLHLFNGAMAEFYEGLSIDSTLDMILTGILFSRGSNYFSDLVSKLARKDGLTEADILALNEDGITYLGYDEDYMEDYVDEDDEEEENEDGTPEYNEEN